MDDPLLPNPYKVLSVPKDATLPLIRSAHRKLVLACHPDKVQDESAKKAKAEQFHLVQQAYEILSDDDRRQRWDDKAKLAELEAELMEERGPRKAPEYGSARPPQSPIYTSRDYEPRVQRTTRFEEVRPRRTYEEEAFPKYTEVRPTSRKYDDRYTESHRRTSGRAQDEKKRDREYEEQQRRKKEASARDEKERRRARDRRMDSEAKSRSKFASVEDEDEDSEIDGRYYSSKSEGKSKRKVFERRNSREEVPRRSNYDDDLLYKTSLAQEHMNKSREAVEIEPRRPARERAASHLDRVQTSPHPVDPGRRSSGDNGRRNSGRGHTSRANSPVRKHGKRYEVLDPPTRKPSMPAASSDPKGIKTNASRKEASRSATYQTPPEFKHPGMRRAETMPANRARHVDPIPTKSSHLKNAREPSETSDESTDSELEEREPPRTSRPQQYKVKVDMAQAFVMEPETYRERSPRARRSPDHHAARASNNTRTPPPLARSTTFAYAPEDRPSPRQSYSRAESSRKVPTLNTKYSSRGQVPALQRNHHRRALAQEPLARRDLAYDDLRSPKTYSRRGSADPDPDSYPGSFHKSHRSGRPREPVC